MARAKQESDQPQNPEALLTPAQIAYQRLGELGESMPLRLSGRYDFRGRELDGGGTIVEYFERHDGVRVVNFFPADNRSAAFIGFSLSPQGTESIHIPNLTQEVAGYWFEDRKVELRADRMYGKERFLSTAPRLVEWFENTLDKGITDLSGLVSTTL